MKKLPMIGIVISIVIVLIGVFSIIGGTANTMIDGADRIASPNNCTPLGYDLNASNNVCIIHNGTGGTYQYPAGFPTALPLASLFSPTGVVLTVIIMVMFAGMIFFGMKTLKNK